MEARGFWSELAQFATHRRTLTRVSQFAAPWVSRVNDDREACMEDLPEGGYPVRL
jgi:hypothetical protein